MEPWEFHPTLIHFPIAFLIAAVGYDLYLWARGDHGPSTIVNWLYIAGMLTAAVAAIAGAVAFFTAPASYTDEAADMIWWHIGGAVTQFVLFAVVAIARYRHRYDASPNWTRVLGVVAALVLIFAGYEGGYIVYHGATGIEPNVLARDLRAKQEKKAAMTARQGTSDRGTVTR
jgi:uncharacterized membrane protein